MFDSLNVSRGLHLNAADTLLHLFLLIIVYLCFSVTIVATDLQHIITVCCRSIIWFLLLISGQNPLYPKVFNFLSEDYFYAFKLP